MKIFTHDLTSATSLRTASFVGKAGIAPFSVTVRAPQAFAKRRASLNRSSSCQNANNKIYDSRKYAHITYADEGNSYVSRTMFSKFDICYPISDSVTK